MAHVLRMGIAGLLAIASFSGGPALAQINLAGQWTGQYHEDEPDRLPGPELGDYGGLPLNDADRMRAQAWSASILSVPLALMLTKIGQPVGQSRRW